MEESHIYLSQDMLVEILLRLPIKSLMLCRCVCKSRYQIIASPCFINSQRNTVPNANDLYLLCEYYSSYTLICQDKLSNERKYCYTPELFGFNEKSFNYYSGLRVHASCMGLLCVSDNLLYISSIIYLWNPVIRKAKKIPKIPIEPPEKDASLCLGYFDDDYKVIRIAAFQANYRVGVYSLRSDSWKITYCDSKYKDGSFNWCPIYSSSRCVSGVAYLLKYRGIIVCFDLHQERIREIELPDTFGPYFRSINENHSFFMEACGESIGLIEVKDGNLGQWVLNYCGVTKSSTWEKKLTVDLKAAGGSSPLGFTYTGKYVLRDYNARRQGYEFYVWDFEKSELDDFEICDDGKGGCLCAVEYLVGNLVLLNEEENVDPLEEIEQPYSTQTRLVLHKCKRWKPRNKGSEVEILQKALNKLQGRTTKRKIEET